MPTDPREEDRLFGALLTGLGLVPSPEVERLLAAMPAAAPDELPGRLARALIDGGLLTSARLLAGLHGRRVPLICRVCGTTREAESFVPERGETCGACASPMAIRGVPAELLAPRGGATQIVSTTPASDRRATVGAATLVSSRSGPAPQAAAPAAPAPEGIPFGRYSLMESLGEGGMGVVWKAWDSELDRIVALKQIRGDGGPDTIARFQREARLAAGLRHPGIVAVHDVGEIAGKPYLTMDYVEGRTFEKFLEATKKEKLAGARPDLARMRQEIAILADVADAVAYAHERGVIHRDLKHGNVLLDRSDRPFVMDFGLAREVDGSEATGAGVSKARSRTLTMDGQLVGTPMFMSPEQARGDRMVVGVRSDVWSLGVMLYDVLAGETPFEQAGNPWEIMAAVVNEDPTAPRARNRHVPAELEAVSLKAMEKEPERRYRSAAEFAEELRRWLRGDPVAARRQGLIDRVWRRILRHRVLTTVGAAACAIVLAAGGFAWRENARRAEAAREASEARRAADQKQRALVAQLRNVSGLALTAALELRRAGITGRQKAFAEALDRAFEDVRREAPELAEPYFHAGRMKRALGAWDDALALQEQALARDPRHAPSLYERAVIYAHRYQQRWSRAYDAAMAADAMRLERAGAAGERPLEPGLAEVEKSDVEMQRSKAEIVESLRRLQAAVQADPAWAEAAVEVLRVGPARLACIDGLLALYGSGATADVRRRLEDAVRLDPTLEEAFEAMYQAEIWDGRWDLAAEAAGLGIEQDRGYVPHRLNRSTARLNLAGNLGLTDEQQVALSRGAIEDLDWVLAREAGQVEALRLRGGVLANWATRDLARGRDPAEHLRGAFADFDAALARDPTVVEAWMWRGNAWHETAVDAANHRDLRAAGEAFAKAVADQSHAIDLRPEGYEAWCTRGICRTNWAREAAPEGTDPEALLGAAEEDFTKALKLNPVFARAWRGRASVRVTRAGLAAGHGVDAGPMFADAEADLDHAVELEPGRSEGWDMRGEARAAWAMLLVSRGRDPRDLLGKAVLDFRKAQALEPDNAERWLGSGGMWLNWANALTEGGGDSDPVYERALREYDHAVELAPGVAAYWIQRGLARKSRGIARARRGGDAGEFYGAAETDFGQAIELNPGSKEARLARTVIRLELAQVKASAREDAESCYEGAQADCAAVLASAPQDVEVLLQRGDVRVGWGRYRMGQRKDPLELFAGATADFDRVIALAPGNAEAWEHRGIAQGDWATVLARRKEDAEARFASAIADLGRALELTPQNEEARFDRGALWKALGEHRLARGNPAGEAFASARKDLTAVLEKQPDLAAARKMIEEIQDK